MISDINIAALLKDCPKGTKLYSPIFGECEFGHIDYDNYNRIYVLTQYKVPQSFKENGVYYMGGECLLFPSKENRDWSTFKKSEEERPKFKVGDVVIADNEIRLVSCKKDDNTEFYYITPEMVNSSVQTYSLATPEEIDLWNEETLHPNHLHYSKSKRKIIHWFLPFDRVVVKNFGDGQKYNVPPYACWCAQIFSHYVKGDKQFPYHCLNDAWSVCLPYNEATASLIGTIGGYIKREAIKEEFRSYAP